MTSPELINGLRQADEAMMIAQVRGYALDADYKRCTALADEARRIAAEPEPVAAPVRDVKTLRRYCSDRAADLVDWRGRTAEAEKLDAQYRLEAGRAGRDAAPAIVALLVEEANTKIVPDAERLLTTAPHDLIGYEETDLLELHAELRRVIIELSNAAHQRGLLAVTTGEGAYLGHDGPAFLFINPGRDVYVSAIEEAITLTKRGTPTTITAWSTFVPLTISFASSGEAAQRHARYLNARAAAKNAPSGGMIDCTYGELLDLG